MEQAPTKQQYLELVKSVGWASDSGFDPETQIKAAVHCVIAEDIEARKVVGCAFLVGDDKTIYYVKDVIVHPDYQLKRIGTALMQNIEQYLNTKGAHNATVGLYTGEGLIPFYRQFGFNQMGGAMYRTLKRN